VQLRAIHTILTLQLMNSLTTELAQMLSKVSICMTNYPKGMI